MSSSMKPCITVERYQANVSTCTDFYIDFVSIIEMKSEVRLGGGDLEAV